MQALAAATLAWVSPAGLMKPAWTRGLSDSHAAKRATSMDARQGIHLQDSVSGKIVAGLCWEVVARTHLVLPLRGHDLGVDARDLDARVVARLQVGLHDVARDGGPGPN